MKRRILRRIALSIAIAILLPLTGVAEIAPIAAAGEWPVDDDIVATGVEKSPETIDDLDLPSGDTTPSGVEENFPLDEIIDGVDADETVDPASDANDVGNESAFPADGEDREDPAQAQDEASADAEVEESERPEVETAADDNAALQDAGEQAGEDTAASVVDDIEAVDETIELFEEGQMKLMAAASVPGAIALGVKEKYTLGIGDGFTTSKKAVATVNAAGVITAKKKGKAVITVTSGGNVIGTCQVTVKAAPKKITLPKKQTVTAGQSIILKAKVSGGSASKITWSSSNPGVASVDENGMVTALSMGKAKITARTYNKKKAVCTITVQSPYAPTSVGFPMGTLFVGKGESVQLRPVVNPGAEATFTYTSKNKKVASVSKAGGVVKGKKLNKTTKVTVKTQNGKKATLKVKVLKAPNSVSLNTGAVALNLGGAAQLSATLPNKMASQIYWTSSNPGVVAVSEGNPFTAGNGSSVTITAVGGGSATITATTFNGKSASCAVTVNVPAPAATPKPAATPTPAATATPKPTDPPTDNPTDEPTTEPTDGPTDEPTDNPTTEPTDGPTDEPTTEPTTDPTDEPTTEPTTDPTDEPTTEPTTEPTPELAAPTYEISATAVKQGESLEITITNEDQGLEERYQAELLNSDDEAVGDPYGAVDKKITIDTTDLAVGEYKLRITATAGEESKSAEDIDITIKPAKLADVEYTLLVDESEITDSSISIERGKTLVIQINNADQGLDERYTATLSNDETSYGWNEETHSIDTSGIVRGEYALKITATAEGYSDVSVEVSITVTSEFDMENGVVTGYNGAGGEIEIPAKDYDGNTITSIGASAFEGCTALTSVSIPNSVKSIGKAAFKDCASLSSMKTYNVAAE